MKKYILSSLLILLSISLSNAQEWVATLNTSNGLPGVSESFLSKEYYRYTSPQFTPGVAVDRIRITVTNTITDEAINGNNKFFALSELIIYDGDGNEVDYIAYSNADHNSLWYVPDGGGLEALSDNDLNTYFHSLWQAPGVPEYHYLELSLGRSIETFSVEWTTRLGTEKNSPTAVGITLGTEYDPEALAGGFELGAPVATQEELFAESQLFVLRSNAVKSFTSDKGETTTGSGPLYMLYAEEGDAEATSKNLMQLVPVSGGRYLLYWPRSGKFLSNSVASYNGKNGWQYSTSDFLSAAEVKLKSVDGGFFEIEYDGTYLGSAITVYVGAEMRDGVNSKMKIFTLEHKNYLENGIYDKGYTLPIAFNWSIYKANLSGEAVSSLSVEFPQLAAAYLQPFITKAEGYLRIYGDHSGFCTNGENTKLNEAIENTRQAMESVDNIEAVGNTEQTIVQALSRYMSAGLSKYESRINSLLTTERFSSFPYTPGTYPETSKTMLEDLLTTISAAKAKAGVYSAEEYEALYSQLENDIANFKATKIEDAAGGETPEESTPELVEGEVVFVYLKNGNIDAYILSSLDGNYYEENGTLYFPIAEDELVSYTNEEYDSCSFVFPLLPEMTSFKFNNKYNPNLNVDAEAQTIESDIYFSLNAIGKWLTASFQLSDDRAVAFVDTVLQVSKVTRQSFDSKVTYNVTYPGYNIVERVKVQDELWTTPVADSDTVEVQLTADMLSTNKPSQETNEGLENLLDNDPYTIFHSTWGSANNATVNLNTYIQVDLKESVENIQLYYKCRPGNGYNPLVLEIYAGNEDGNWTLVRTLSSTNDNMPTGGVGQEFRSPTIALGGNYSKLRILQTSGEYSKNHFVLSELRLYKVLLGSTTEEPEKIQDAVYANRYRPFGREYNIHIEWLTDNAASVPRIDIDIEDGLFVTSKEYYLNANFRITGYGVYENFEDSVQIKGRGNSTWGGYGHKNPYRLKFAEKVKPFGLTKGKSWVLLANAQQGSLMANAISMKIGQLTGTEYVNHIIPVELYINGVYQGSYMFTEKVGMANNSVDIDEALGYLLELDTYTSADEPIFRTGVYKLPVKISEPDLEDLPDTEAAARVEKVQNDVRTMSNVVKNGGDIESVLDMQALARFYLANDLSLNQEINHPKSTFLFMDESEENPRLKFGPIWDFDWGFGYESGKSYCYNGATSSVISNSMEAAAFWQDITNNEIFRKHYYMVWTEFLQNNSMDELLEYIDSYYNFAKNSFQNNYNYGHTNFTESDAQRAKQWLQARRNYLVGNLTEYNIDELLHPLPGDVNCNDFVTVHDAALVVAHLNSNTHPSFNAVKADYDNSGEITLDDAAAVANLVLASELPSPMYWYTTPEAIGNLYAADVEFELGTDVVFPVNILSYNAEGYSALQFDVKVPDGLFVYDITPGDVLDGYNFSWSQLDMNTYRAVLYSNENNVINTGDNILFNVTAGLMSVVEEGLCTVNISNVYAVNGDNDECRMDNIAIGFGQTTGIGNNIATLSIKGGSCITITALEAYNVEIYSIDGRLVRCVNVEEGTTRISLPAGLYVVDGCKVLVY